MTKRVIAFAGSFDPITVGHRWVIQEALSLADEVLVVVAVNPEKSYWFSPETRVKIIEDMARDEGWDNVRVETLIGEYVAPALKQRGINHMIRGIRSGNDFDQERLLQRANVEVLDGARTWFVAPPPDLESVSSSFVKSLIGPINWPFFVKSFLPQAAYKAVLRRVLYQDWLKLNNVEKNMFKNYLDNDNWLSSDYCKVSDPIARSFVCLMTAYESKDRYYHTTEHIASVITELKSRKFSACTHPSVILAAFFHDAVYRGLPSDDYWGVGPIAGDDDESKSASLIHLLLPDLGSKLVNDAENAVLSTNYSKTPPSNDKEHALTSADLSILGQPDKIYRSYALNVRKEYAEIPSMLYKEKRAQVLRKIIDQIKNNQLFDLQVFSQYRERAINNMEDEIKHLNSITDKVSRLFQKKG